MITVLTATNRPPRQQLRWDLAPGSCPRDTQTFGQHSGSKPARTLKEIRPAHTPTSSAPNSEPKNDNQVNFKWNSISPQNTSEVFHEPTLEMSPAAMTLDTCLQCRKSPNFPFTTLVTTNRTTTQAELPGTASRGRQSRSQSRLS